MNTAKPQGCLSQLVSLGVKIVVLTFVMLVGLMYFGGLQRPGSDSVNQSTVGPASNDANTQLPVFPGLDIETLFTTLERQGFVKTGPKTMPDAFGDSRPHFLWEFKSEKDGLSRQVEVWGRNVSTVYSVRVTVLAEDVVKWLRNGRGKLESAAVNVFESLLRKSLVYDGSLPDEKMDWIRKHVTGKGSQRFGDVQFDIAGGPGAILLTVEAKLTK